MINFRNNPLTCKSHSSGGGHTHSEYASEQELTDLKSELEGKIEAIDAEWERKQQSIDNEMSFWQHSLLSLFEMLHSATSGKDTINSTINTVQNYVQGRIRICNSTGCNRKKHLRRWRIPSMISVVTCDNIAGCTYIMCQALCRIH